MQEVAFVSNRGEICAFRNFFGVLHLLDFVSRNVDGVIVLQRQLNGLMQGDVARTSGIARLLGKSENARQC